MDGWLDRQIDKYFFNIGFIDRYLQTCRHTHIQTNRRTDSSILVAARINKLLERKCQDFLDTQNHGDHCKQQKRPATTIEPQTTEQPGSGNLLFISGQIPKMPDNSLLKGGGMEAQEEGRLFNALGQLAASSAMLSYKM